MSSGKGKKMSSTLGKRLKELREERGFTQKQLAERLYLHSVAFYIMKKRNANHPRRRRLSRNYSNPVTPKKTPRKRGVWCTRWGSNPNSTASEAVMLSNYTTSTYKFSLFFQKAFLFYYFLLSFCKRLWYTIFKFKKKFFQNS